MKKYIDKKAIQNAFENRLITQQEADEMIILYEYCRSKNEKILHVETVL